MPQQKVNKHEPLAAIKSEIGKESPRQTDPRNHCSAAFFFPLFSYDLDSPTVGQPKSNYTTDTAISQDLPLRLFRDAQER